MTGLGNRVRPLIGYGFALCALGIALAVSLAIPALFEPYPFLLFFVAATLSAWYGGLGPGALASVLSILVVNHFYLYPAQTPGVYGIDFARLVVFGAVTVVVSLIHLQYRRTLDDLRRSRDQLNIYLRDMANGITVQDRTGKLIYANYEAAKVMGFVSGESLINADADEVLERFDIFDELGEPFPLTSLPGRLALLGMQYPEAVLRYHFKNTGKENWAFVKARPVFNEKGDVQSAISLFLDITELKQAQRALDDQREQFRVTLRSIGDAVIATDTTGRITFINPVAAKLTGWAEAAALDRSISTILHLEDEQTHAPLEIPIERVLGQSGAVDLAQHTALVAKDKTERPVEITGASILDLQEKPIGMVLVFRDMTERRAAEASLQARVSQQEVVAALGLRALSGIDLPTLMQEATKRLAETLHVEYAKLLEQMPDKNALRLRAGVGWRGGLVGKATVDAGTGSQSGYALLSNEPVIVTDLRTETRFHAAPLLTDHGVISGISVLIAGDEHPWGVLGAHTSERRIFTRDDINFLQAIANLLALSINRERIERAEREQRVYAEALRDTAEALSSTLDLAQVLDRILENVEKVVPHDAADIMLIEGKTAHIKRHRGYEDFNLAGTILDFRLPTETTPTLAAMIETRKPLIVADSGTWTGWKKMPGMEWLCSYMGVPLIVQGTVVGFLNVSSVTEGFFTPEQATRLQAFAAQAMVAIRNAQLYDNARKQA